MMTVGKRRFRYFACATVNVYHMTYHVTTLYVKLKVITATSGLSHVHTEEFM